MERAHAEELNCSNQSRPALDEARAEALNSAFGRGQAANPSCGQPRERVASQRHSEAGAATAPSVSRVGRE
jgi:hypothetical protein